MKSAGRTYTSVPFGTTYRENYGTREDSIKPDHLEMMGKAMNSRFPGVCDMVMLIIKADRENKLIGFRDCQTTFTPRGLARKLCTGSASLDVSLYTVVPLVYKNIAPNCHIGDDGKFTNPSGSKPFVRKILGHSFPNESPNPFRKWLRD
jgi:hypothetical protein